MNRYIAFCHVVETGSFCKTADQMGYSQSAVSQMIRSLEQEIGTPLLIRSKGSVELTFEGKELYPLIRSVVNNYRVLQEKTKELQGKISGEIRIGTIASVSNFWLPKMIKEFQNRYPESRFTLLQGEYTTISEWVKNGEVDFGFSNMEAVSGLTKIPLYTDEMMAVLPQTHPLSKKKAIPLAELVKDPYIRLEEGAFNEPMNAFRSLGLEPDVRLNVYDDYTVLAMIEEGLGYSIIPEMNLLRHDYRVVKRSLEPKITRDLCLIYRHFNVMPHMSRIFIEYIEDHFFHLHNTDHHEES
ncbi:MAG: LysR family transcriptional regulator [Firmicutes bacterium]|nr:LysR family transcriptional regulator [Bacillota bacterium]